MKVSMVAFILLLAAIALESCRKMPDQIGNCSLGGVITDVTNMQQDTTLIFSLLKELELLSGKDKCTPADKWKFIPYGENTCGGPLGYLPYKTSIDTTCFFKKLSHFDIQYKHFNRKYSLWYPCVIAKRPKSAICNNGKLEVQY